MHEKVKNNAKRRVNRHTSLGREKICKKFGGKQQKILCGALSSQKERKGFEKFFEKVV